MEKRIHFIGACTCWGAQIHSCELGPADLFQFQAFERLRKGGVKIGEIELIFPAKVAREEEVSLPSALFLVHEFNLRLADAVYRALQRGEFPLVVGGDHSIAVGTWNGVYKALFEAKQLPLGLIWIDAHMDAHTPETTPSGAWHGMPIAALLGYGDPKMASLLQNGAVLAPPALALIGIRSYEEGEAALLKRLKVKVYFMDEVKKRGIKEVFLEAREHVLKSARSFGVSLDLDVLDPSEAPGVGSPVKGGMHKEELLSLCSSLGSDPRFAAFELAEFNPELDFQHKTRQLSFEILAEVLQ